MSPALRPGETAATPGTTPVRSVARIAPRRRLANAAVRVLVAAGGFTVIASIAGILAFIVREVWPLTRGATMTIERPVVYRGPDLLAAVADEYRELVVGVAADGTLLAVRGNDGEVIASRELLATAAGTPGVAGDDSVVPPEPAADAGEPTVATAAPRLVAAAASPDADLLSAATDDGRVVAVRVGWDTSYDGGSRRIAPSFGEPVWLDLDPLHRALRLHSVSMDADGAGRAAAVRADGTLAVARRATRENLLTGEITGETTIETAPLDTVPSTLLVDHGQDALYAGTASGELLWWDLRQGLATPPARVGSGAAVTALTLLLGGRSLVAGGADGSLGVFTPVRDDDGAAVLTRIHTLPAHAAAIRRLAPSHRNRSFLAWSEDGELALHHSTSERRLRRAQIPSRAVGAMVFAPRADGAWLTAPGELLPVAISSPHPETTLRTLFLPVWYEGYPRPELVWQSSGGSDDFEPKLSLTPLMVGTLKGTVYSLLLAIPVGVLGAVYVSQFMHPAYQRRIKPLIEVMAALPTVVLGFLAGLWLAPLLERLLPGLAAAALLLPPLLVATAWLWRRLPARTVGRLPAGTEVLVFAVVIAAGLALAVAASAPLETVLFGGDFRAWLERATGLGYDQRNAVVVGLAMGFAVIPILFAISEDALSNVPRNLVAGSLALGATRWQTVLRVVLPTASPGIFSAIMVGFGRAVGETMIVLMATGNTPILSLSPWNGFRTLSANIAVEIPEAPVGGTLYRTLFLAALVLFVLTFLVNTVAELVRQRLRERFSRL